MMQPTPTGPQQPQQGAKPAPKLSGVLPQPQGPPGSAAPEQSNAMPSVTPEELQIIATALTPQTLPAIMKVFSAVLVDAARAATMASKQQQQQPKAGPQGQPQPAPKPGLMGPGAGPSRQPGPGPTA